MSKKPNTTHNIFLEKFLGTIINENLNFHQIVKLSKKEGIKGLTNNKIKDFLKTRGLTYDSISKRWINDFENLNTPSSPFAEPSSPTNYEETHKNIKQLDELPNGEENYPSNISPINRPDVTKESVINSKQLEELSKKISNQEQLNEEILRKISEIEVHFKDKIENSLSKCSSDASLGISQFVELSYSNRKRYEVTLREDLVNKATEKLKNRYDLETIDLTKLSQLFEIIFFDYLNSSK